MFYSLRYLRIKNEASQDIKVIMKKSSIDIIRIIEESIAKNEANNIGPNGGKIFAEFKNEDFEFIFNYTKIYGRDIDVVKFISFCIKDFWGILSRAEINKDLWGKNFVSFNFLKVLICKLCSIIDSYDELLQKGKVDEALSLFRNYLELSSILFASSVDIDFFNKYTLELESNDDYIRFWYSHLKPSQVVKKLKLIKKSSGDKMINYYIERFTGRQREVLYAYSSSVSHGKFSHITRIESEEENDILVTATDFLVNSTLLIHLINYNYICYHSDKEERKLQIISGIWLEILYKHLLK